MGTVAVGLDSWVDTRDSGNNEAGRGQSLERQQAGSPATRGHEELRPSPLVTVTIEGLQFIPVRCSLAHRAAASYLL